MLKWRKPALVLGLALAAAPAAAQETPEQVVSAYFGHLSRGEMRQAGALIHPRALESFKVFMSDPEQKMMLQGDAVDMPADVASLPADSVFSLMLNGLRGSHEEARAVFSGLRVDVLGHLDRGDASYVTYTAETRMGDTPVSHAGLVVLRREGARWRIDPGDGMLVLLGNGGAMQLLMSMAWQLETSMEPGLRIR